MISKRKTQNCWRPTPKTEALALFDLLRISFFTKLGSRIHACSVCLSVSVKSINPSSPIIQYPRPSHAPAIPWPLCPSLPPPPPIAAPLQAGSQPGPHRGETQADVVVVVAAAAVAAAPARAARARPRRARLEGGATPNYGGKGENGWMSGPSVELSDGVLMSLCLLNDDEPRRSAGSRPP